MIKVGDRVRVLHYGGIADLSKHVGKVLTVSEVNYLTEGNNKWLGYISFDEQPIDDCFIFEDRWFQVVKQEKIPFSRYEQLYAEAAYWGYL